MSDEEIQKLNNQTTVNRYDKDEMYFVNLSDIHLGAKAVNKKLLNKYINIIKQNDFAVVIGGDMFNSALPNSKSNIFEEESSGMNVIDELYKLLEPIKDKILCCCEGNHTERMLKQVNLSSAQVLAYKLNVKYVHGYACNFININKNFYSILSYHAGRKPDQLVKHFAVDVLIQEHLHKTKCEKFLRFEPNKFTKTWTSNYYYTLNAGTFHEYFGTYAERKAYLPQYNEPPIIRLSGKNTGKDIQVFESIDFFSEYLNLKKGDKQC